MNLQELLYILVIQKNAPIQGLPGSPAVKSPPSKEEGTRILHATGRLGPQVTATEPTGSGAHALQLERSPCSARRDPYCGTKTHVLQLRPNASKMSNIKKKKKTYTNANLKKPSKKCKTGFTIKKNKKIKK